MPDQTAKTPFFDRITARVRAVGSALCVGLDPHPEDLPEPTAQAALDFCRRIVEATSPYAAAFKPNAAFFEALGAEGFAALREVIALVPPEIPVILDAKRGDIGSTSQAYARAAFDVLGADAITLHGWMGPDSVAPFVHDAAHAAFVLCRTSNPGASALQECEIEADDGTRIAMFEHLAAQAASWSEHANVGLVVGATSPDALARVRAAAPEAWILAPGVGAQGGSLAPAVAAGSRADGLGLLINVSRSIARAPDPRAAAADYAAQLAAVRPERPRFAPDPVADGLLATGCVRFGEFKLKSGLMSPIYLDLRRLVASPRLMAHVARAYARVMRGLSYDLIAPLPYAALPIGTAVSLQMNEPMIYPRKEVKNYGTSALVEGVYEAGQTAVMLDDLATTGGSKIEAVERLHAVGLKVHDVVVLIDRQSGAAEMLEAAGLRMHAVYKLTDLLERWEAQGQISPAQAASVRAFLEASTS